MADITYHEKAGANPNEPASEDTVVDVLRKAVDKRVSSPQYPVTLFSPVNHKHALGRSYTDLCHLSLTSVACLQYLSLVFKYRRSFLYQSQAAGAYPEDHPSHQQFLSEIALISKFLPRTLSVEQITQILEGIVTGMTEADKTSKGATGQVLTQFWQVVKKGEVQNKKELGKTIARLLVSSKRT
jgi:uncharacterized protein YqeY